MDESIFQPEWSPDGILYFVSDRSNWWNLYRWRGGQAEPVFTLDAEFARPQWRLATPTYGFQSAGRIICTYTQGGFWYAGSIAITSEDGPGSFTPIPIPYSEMGRGEIAIDSGKAVLVAGSPVEPYSLIKLNLSTGNAEVLRRSTSVVVDTNILIDYLEGFDQARLELDRHDVILLSPISWMEVLVGAKPGADEQRVRRFLRRLLRR